MRIGRRHRIGSDVQRNAQRSRKLRAAFDRRILLPQAPRPGGVLDGWTLPWTSGPPRWACATTISMIFSKIGRRESSESTAHAAASIFAARLGASAFQADEGVVVGQEADAPPSGSGRSEIQNVG